MYTCMMHPSITNFTFIAAEKLLNEKNLKNAVQILKIVKIQILPRGWYGPYGIIQLYRCTT